MQRRQTMLNRLNCQRPIAQAGSTRPLGHIGDMRLDSGGNLRINAYKSDPRVRLRRLESHGDVFARKQAATTQFSRVLNRLLLLQVLLPGEQVWPFP